ncbi:MAG: VCBS repeat-containing protein [Polyangiaceae bacterium]
MLRHPPSSPTALGLVLAGWLAGPVVVHGGCAPSGDGTDPSRGGTSSEGGGDGGSGAQPPLCAASHFGAPSEHRLPGNYTATAFEHLAGAGDCNGGAAKPSHGLVDLDGDGLVDLVVTDDCLSPDVGRNHWLLHRNDGRRFGPATPWPLPDYGPRAFEHLDGAGLCGGGDLRPHHGLTDLDGDGLVDLVVTDDCSDPALGRDHWRLHRNTGEGFTPIASSWTLPDYGPDAFEDLAGAGLCEGGELRPAFALADLDGDGLVELVVSDNCFDALIGRHHWLIHDNEGGGFTSNGRAWALPDYGPDAFEHLASAGSCTGGKLQPAFGLADLDGDGKVDLVVTDDCVDDTVGRSRWLWHANDGAAFASSGAAWAVPDYGPEALDQLSSAGACTGGKLEPAYALMDLTGDGELELVVTDDCVDPSLGRTAWHIHPRSGAAFALSPIPFGLPDYGPNALEHVAGAGSCEGGELRPSHGLVDLDGEGHLDLVVTDDCKNEGLGHTHWLRHDGACP